MTRNQKKKQQSKPQTSSPQSPIPQQAKNWQWWIEKVIVPILLAIIPGYFLLLSTGIIDNPFKSHATPTVTPTVTILVGISATPTLNDVPSAEPSPEKSLSAGVQVMDQYYQYINNAGVSNDLLRAWDLMTRKLQCNPSDQCNFESYRKFWWGQQVHYKLYDCGPNIVDAELIYFARGTQPLEGIKPVYLRYTLAEEDGQLKLYGGEKIDGISAYCLLAVTYP